MAAKQKDPVLVVVQLSGAGHVGEGEDITWDQIDQIELLRGGTQLTWLHGARQFDEQSELVRLTCDAVMKVRDLSVGPGNFVTPTYLAETARELAEKFGLEITIWGKDEMRARGMNAILAVNAGGLLLTPDNMPADVDLLRERTCHFKVVYSRATQPNHCGYFLEGNEVFRGSILMPRFLSLR